MELNPADHILAAVLLVVVPLKGVFDFRRLRGRLVEGRADARLGYYRATFAEEWVLAVAVIVTWVVCGRAFSLLGFSAGAPVGFWIALAVTVVVCGLLIVQANALFRNPDRLKMAAMQFESVQALVPRTVPETRAFNTLSVTAGIGEELLYRGFLIAYLRSAIPAGGIWPAVFLSSILFGLAHAYQGPKGIWKTASFGLVMAGIYLLGGTLYLVIVLHAVVDLVNGNIGRHAMAAVEARGEAKSG